jgi:hypothetical protein
LVLNTRSGLEHRGRSLPGDAPLCYSDQIVSSSQTLPMLDALRAKGVDGTHYVLTEANHGNLAFTGHTKSGLPWTTQQVMGDIVSFLSKRLGN